MVYLAEKQSTLGSSVLVAGGGASTPSDHCRGALEQGIEPANAQIGYCNELATYRGVDLCPCMHPPCDPKSSSEDKTLTIEMNIDLSCINHFLQHVRGKCLG